MNTPTTTMLRQGASGREMKKMAGSTTAVNLIATKSNGGTSAMPQSMTTKLKPQMVATRAARSESREFTRRMLAGLTMKHQQTLVHRTM